MSTPLNVEMWAVWNSVSPEASELHLTEKGARNSVIYPEETPVRVRIMDAERADKFQRLAELVVAALPQAGEEQDDNLYEPWCLARELTASTEGE